MPTSGSLIVRTFLSNAQLPVPDATVIVYTTSPGEKKLIKSILITDESGIAGPITLPASDNLGLTPGVPVPFTDYQLVVEHPDFQLAVFRNLQIFSGVETVQDVPLIPLSPDGVDSNSTTVTPQPL